jgi:hypothetical protein
MGSVYNGPKVWDLYLSFACPSDQLYPTGDKVI